MFFFIIIIIASLHTILLAKSLIEINKSMIKVGNDSIFGIDTKYVFDYDIDIESKL